MVRLIGGSPYGTAKICVSQSDTHTDECDMAGAQELRSAVMAAQHWTPDLMWLLVPVTVAVCMTCFAFSVYGIVVAPSASWPVLISLFLVYAGYALLVWLIANWWPGARTLDGLTYVAVVMAIGQLVLLVVWVTPAMDFVQDQCEWLYWTLFGLVAGLCVLTSSLAMSVASLCNARYHCDGHQNLARGMVAHTDSLERQGQKASARIGSGMLEFRAMLRAGEAKHPATPPGLSARERLAALRAGWR